MMLKLDGEIWLKEMLPIGNPDENVIDDLAKLKNGSA
jgi:hypothetical protein